MRSLSLILLFLPFLTIAQFNSADIGIGGLTCSACTRAVEKSISKLRFVDSVAMNLENTSGKIFFKKNEKIEMERVASAVADAGFSVIFLKALFTFANSSVSENYCFYYENDWYQFIGINKRELSGEILLTFIGENFQLKKDFKKWKSRLVSKCTEKKGKIYYVTL